jgi:hypothetical protein
MTALKAKCILKDKFWIVEKDKERIGTLSWDEDRYVFSSTEETSFFNNKNEVKKKFGIEIHWDEPTPPTEQDKEVHGFPTSVVPFNSMYDVQRKLPLFTKSEKSKSLYAAGYYIIRFEKGWVKSFCPKLITVERYDFKGPFKTSIEMKQELSLANAS